MRQGLDAMTEGWDFSGLAPEAKATAQKAASDACKQGTDAVEQGSKAAGCS